MFKGYEILIEGVVLKANLIPLEMWDFDVILGIDWLFTPSVSGLVYKESCVSKTKISKVGI